MRSSILALALVASAATGPAAHAEVTLTFGGDMNFNSSRVSPRPDGALKNGKLYSFNSLMAGIRPYIDGDLNFANLETVVTDQNLPDTKGTFVFSSHPNSIRAAIGIGFNLFNLSNNHAGDHGMAGMLETLKHMEKISSETPVHYHGVAANRSELLEPEVFDVRSKSGTYRIAMLSMTSVSNTPTQATNDRAGTLYFRDSKDFSQGLAKLKGVRADYKILSIHGGLEGKVVLDSGQKNLYERALELGDVDLILGHHPHRVRPVEKVGDKIILYSLGNYLMLGAANINPLADVADYGLLGKLHLEWDARENRLVAQAMEAIPIYDMQLQPKPFDKSGAAARLKALNDLGNGQLGARNVHFTIVGNQGENCLGQNPGPRAAAICARVRD